MAWALSLAHLAALAALCLPMTLPVAVRIPLALLVAWSLWRTLRRHAWLNAPEAVVRLVWAEDGLWTLVLRDGTSRSARLLEDSYLSVPLIVLRLGFLDGGHRSVVLLGDMLDADTLRRLRVRLKLDGTGESEE